MAVNEVAVESRENAFLSAGARWVMISVAIGTILGLLLLLVPHPTFGPRFSTFQFLAEVDIVIDTVVLALAVSLVYLYARTFSETRAPFALGLLFVLAAMMFHAVFTYPIFLALFDRLSYGVLFILPVHAFEVVALAAFLYLSAQ